MSTVHLETIEVIYYFENRIQEGKQKAVRSVVIGIWEGETKKGISCILLTPLVYKWRPRRDLNSCRRRERPVSWTWLDDGDENSFADVVGRVGLEPTTLCLKGRYSTD